MFWDNHDPTQGMRQGNDVGTQYRSGIYSPTRGSGSGATASRDAFQRELTKAGYGADHDGDRSGPGVLLRGGLPPAVSRQESGGLLRVGRYRSDLSGGCRRQRLTRSSCREPSRSTLHWPIAAVRTALHRSGRDRAAGAGKTTRIPPRCSTLVPRSCCSRVASPFVPSRVGWLANAAGCSAGRLAGRSASSAFSRGHQVTRRHEGILTARLQSDPLLGDFNTVIIDEFHERSLHADLALALATQAWHARSDLRIVVMSATLDAESVSRFLGGCPIVTIAGRQHPLSIQYAPGEGVARTALRMASEAEGDVLCFLPGAGEIRRTVAEIESLTSHRLIEVLPLHGSLDGVEQDRALESSPTGATRIVVATNIAETSVTVPGIRVVVDSGMQKVARHDAARGIESLTTERISQDSADQRAGRAGRTASGRAVRLWDARDRLSPHGEAEIHRVDLAGAVLDILAWGGHPLTLEWFERPSEEAIDRSMTLLNRLGAVANGRLTDVGRQMQRFSMSPRLARMLIEARGAWTMVQACALLSERLYLAPRHPHDHRRLALGDRRLGICTGTRETCGRRNRAPHRNRVQPISSHYSGRRRVQAGALGRLS